MNRRGALSIFGGLGVAGALAACGTSAPASTTAGTSSAAATSGAAAPEASAKVTGDGALAEAPDETAGPYPGDGSNGADVLDDSGVVRSDIRSSFGTSTTTATGIPLTVKLTVKDLATSQALIGAAVYVWHCDIDGNYSMYSQAIEQENYLRGVQQTDDTGTVTFTSIYPACYSGRWPHIHFEVYASIAHATSSGPIVKTSQIALPEATCTTVYATSGYERSVAEHGSGKPREGQRLRRRRRRAPDRDDVRQRRGRYTAALTVGV